MINGHQAKMGAVNMQAVLTPRQASVYIGIDTKNDALKTSRSTGVLWGVGAPKFIKAGPKKILYKLSDLDEFLSQFESFSNNAEVKESEI